MKRPHTLIGTQLLVFALIASVLNVYALEIWCGLTMNHHPEPTLAALHHPASHDSGAGKMKDCPHQGNSSENSNTCEDHQSLFLSSSPGSGQLSAPLAFAGFTLPQPFNFTFSPATTFANLPVTLYPDVGPKPRLPDLRIFICSLII